jgi:hypothetical protein
MCPSVGRRRGTRKTLEKRGNGWGEKKETGGWGPGGREEEKHNKLPPFFFPCRAQPSRKVFAPSPHAHPSSPHPHCPRRRARVRRHARIAAGERSQTARAFSSLLRLFKNIMDDARSRRRRVRMNAMQAELAVLQALPREDVARYMA